jgi:hypothetical protein
MAPVADWRVHAQSRWAEKSNVSEVDGRAGTGRFHDRFANLQVGDGIAN